MSDSKTLRHKNSQIKNLSEIRVDSVRVQPKLVSANSQAAQHKSSRSRDANAILARMIAGVSRSVQGCARTNGVRRAVAKDGSGG